MNNEILRGNWKQFRGNITQKWNKLTEDDLDTANGSRIQLVAALKARYEITQEDAEGQMKAFEDHNRTALSSY